MKKVLLIDSGSGGINILKECVKIVPYCDYLMFCDSLNLPYGNKSKEELIEITLKNLKNVYKFFKFDIVILACNTLTSTCISACREIFKDVIFIGTVPAIKPALLKFSPEEILVLGTKATIEHNILINKTKGLNLKIMPNLASDIDENLDNLQVLKSGLKEELSNYKVKAVVLGCTHYFALREMFQEILGDNVEIFDSANGVARRLQYFVGEQSNVGFQVQLMTSKDDDSLGRFWWFYNKQ